MPIQISAPDGSVAQFPDGMSDDDISAIMAREYGGPLQPSANNALGPNPSAVAAQLQPTTQLTQGHDLGFSADLANQVPLAAKLAAATGAALQPLGIGGPETVAAPTFGERYQKTLANIRGGIQGYEATNPEHAYAAKAAGVVGPMLIGAGEASPLVNALRGSGIGAAYGFSGTPDTSVSGDFWPTVQGASIGLATAGAGHGVGSLAGNAAGRITDAFTGMPQGKPQSLAASMMMKAMNQQGVTPSDLVSQLAGSTKPITAMDIGGTNSPLQRLGRTMVTLPGQQSQDITDFLNTRQEGQRGRVLGDISSLAPNTDTYGTAADLKDERSVNSNPLYQQAFANPGVGPLNYEADRSALINATSQKGAITKQIKTIEQNNPGALAARGAAGADVRSNYMGLQQQLQDAEATRAAAASKFENTQAGISAMEGNQPLTDSRLNDFMSDPDIQQGMKTGLNIQRRLSLANGEEFDPNTYAITGYDEKGMPQVGPVPTWQTLHAGRMGLDNMIYSQADPLTGKLPQTQDMRSLQALRQAYSSHLHTLNPDLAAADAAWSVPSQNLDAMALGQKFTRADPEQIDTALGRMSPEGQQHYQIGVGRQMRDVANDTRDNNNIPLRLTGDQTARDQLTSAFGQGPATDFTNNMSLENQLGQTRQFVTGGSNTANKASDIADAAHTGWVAPLLKTAGLGAGGGFATGGLHGALIGGLGGAAYPIAKRVASSAMENLFNNDPRNLALGNALTATGPQGAQDLAALFAPAAQRARTIALGSRVGGTLGRGIGSALIPALMSPSANAGP